MIPKEPTSVEEQVLTAFRADSIGVVNADGAEISGDFLRGLFLGEYDTNADYRGTRIENAIISGVLDMEFRETKFPMRFHNCSFVRGISIQQLACPELDFRGCTLIGGFDAKMAKVAGSVNLTRVISVAPVNLANAKIGGQLVCTGGSFLNKEGCAFHAPDVKVDSDVFMRDGFIAVGGVNLAGADIGRQLVCTGGNFWNGKGEAINAQSIKVGDVLLNTDISGSQSINEFRAIGAVWLAGADIRGRLDCAGGNFHNRGKIALNAECIKATSGVVLSDGFNAEGVVSLAGAEIGGQFACSGGSFQNKGDVALKAHSIKVANDVILGNGFNAEGKVTLLGADVGGQLVCAGGNFQNAGENSLIAQNIKVVGDVRLGDGFNAEGTVTLLGADVGGQLICTGGNFQNEEGNALIVQGVKVTGDVFLDAYYSSGDNTKKFKAVGAVWLAYADIKGQLVCNGGIFRNKGKDAVNAQGIKVAGDVLLHGFDAKGKVSFLGASIGGQLSCMGASFQNAGGNALVARGIKVGSDVFLVALVYAHHDKEVEKNFSANGRVAFDSATIGGDLKLEGCEITHLSLSGANVLGEFRDVASVYKDRDGDDIDLNIDGFRYHRLDATKERAGDRLAWVGLMSNGDKFYPQPYEQLMKVYREMGHMNWARKVGFELERKRHKQLRLNRNHKLGWAWWFWYWILRGTIGYGYKPFAPLMVWLILLVGGGLVLFGGTLPCPDPCRVGSGACHCMAPSDASVLLSDDWKIHGKLPKDYPDFDFVYYAVEAALPVLPLGQTENWHPKTWWVRWLQNAITIIGAFVLTILASFGVGVLGPRWKNE